METKEIIPTAEVLDKQIELARLQLENDPRSLQMKLVSAEQAAKFALTPVGQELKRFETLQRMGQMYAQATIVPDTYKGNVANCAIALDMATRMNANPVMVMQNLYIVHGNPSWSSKFLIATINTCGRFEPLMYECNDAKGDEYGWRCYTYSTKDTERKDRLEGTWVTWKMVKAEGWDKKNGSKWLTMPEQMFRYRAAAFWQRMYAPEISMGFMTQEEAEDIAEVTDVEYKEVVSATDAKSRLAALAAERAKEEQSVVEETGEVQTDVKKPDPAIAEHKKRVQDALNAAHAKKYGADAEAGGTSESKE